MNTLKFVVVSILGSFLTMVNASCILDERVYWGMDGYLAFGIHEMFLSDFSRRTSVPRVSRIVAINRIVDLASVPLSLQCAECIVDSFLCYHSVQWEFTQPHPILWPLGITQQTRSEHEVMTEILGRCLPALMECSGFSVPSELPGHWPVLINRYRSYTDGESRAAFAARYSIRDSDGQNALIRGIRSGDTLRYEIWTDTPLAEYRVADRFGKTALDYILEKCENPKILVEFLQFARCWEDAPCWFAVARIWSPEYVESVYSNRPHPPVNTRDMMTGSTAVHFAVISPQRSEMDTLTVVRWLVGKGADIHMRDNRGNTALMLAVSRGMTNLVKYLLSMGANVNDMNGDGMTVLMLASIGQLCILQMLVEKGVSVNVEIRGWSALSLAAAFITDEDPVDEASALELLPLPSTNRGNVKYLLSVGGLHRFRIRPPVETNGYPVEVMNQMISYLPSFVQQGVIRSSLPVAAVEGDTPYIQVAKFRLSHAVLNSTNICPDWSTFAKMDNLFDTYRRCDGHVNRLVCLAEQIRGSRIGCLVCLQQLAHCPKQTKILLAADNHVGLYKHTRDMCIPALSECTRGSRSLPSGWSIHQHLSYKSS